MTGNEERKISSLRDLPLDITPPRDLWQGIEARIAAEQAAAGKRGADTNGAGARGGDAARRFWRTERMRVFAAAAVIAALAVGIWIGRAVLPGPAGASGPPPTLNASNTYGGEASAWHAAYLMNSKYTQQRADLVKDLEARLAALPPESRAKVVSSLKTISDSKRDLEAELGKDPSNALLQELLVNTYQDEMRVLTAVHEAGSTGEGI
jgi:hypothetical protein